MTTPNPSFTLEVLLSNRGWARHLARRLVGDDADDLVQEGWMAGMVSRPTDGAGLGSWLRTVLYRAAAHRRRGEQRRKAREEVVGTLLGSEPAPTPESAVSQVAAQRLLAEVVLGLEPAIRDVIVLRFYEELTSPEIAKALDVPEGTVRWRIKRGLAQLRQELDERHGGREGWMGVMCLVGTDEAYHPSARASSEASSKAARATSWAALIVGFGLAGMTLIWAVNRRNPDEQQRDVTLGGSRLSGPPPSSTASGSRSASSTRRPPHLAVAVTDDCQAQLAELRSKLAAVEPEFVETAAVSAPGALFEHGAPNPAAEALLTQLVNKAFEKLPDPRPLGHRLACRTHVCRVTALVAAGGPGSNWSLPIRRNGDLGERMRGSSPREKGPSLRDPITGASYREEWFYFRIWNPSAEILSREALARLGAPPPSPKPTFGPVPATPDACRAEREAAEQRLANMNGVIERHMLPERRWNRSSVNPSLTIEIGALARQILHLPGDSRFIVVDCRHDVCRIDFDRQRFPGPNDWQALSTPAWRQRTQGPAAVGGWRAYFTITPPPGATGP